MNILKIYLMSVSVLQFIDYDENTEDIILAINVSLTEWEVILMQIDKKMKKRHLIQYKSELWSFSEQNYNAKKWECQDMLKVLKKVCF